MLLNTIEEEEILYYEPGGGVWNFCGGVPPASPNPDPISDQKMPFPTPVFRPDLAHD